MKELFNDLQTPATDAVLVNDKGDSSLIYNLAKLCRQLERDRAGLLRTLQTVIEFPGDESTAAARECLNSEPPKYCGNCDGLGYTVENVTDDEGWYWARCVPCYCRNANLHP